MNHDPETIAQWYWKHNYRFEAADKLIEPFLPMDRQRPPWLRTARRSLFLSCNEVAARIGISQQAYSRMERKELTGHITLAALPRAAEAMGCEVVYAIRPTSRRSFSKEVWMRVRDRAFELSRRQHSPRPGHAWAAAARDLVEKPELRRQHRWTIRKHQTI